MIEQVNQIVRHSRKPARLCGLAAALGMLGGCVSSRTFVLERADESAIYMGVRFEQLPATVGVRPELARRFEERVSGKLGGGCIANSPAADLVITYRFVLFDNGNSAARLGAGIASLAGSPFYGVGDGSLGVEVTYSDQHGDALGRIVVDGPIAGLFGSAEDGVDAAAASVAAYTTAHFLSPSGGNQIAAH